MQSPGFKSPRICYSHHWCSYAVWYPHSKCALFPCFGLAIVWKEMVSFYLLGKRSWFLIPIFMPPKLPGLLPPTNLLHFSNPLKLFFLISPVAAAPVKPLCLTYTIRSLETLAFWMGKAQNASPMPPIKILLKSFNFMVLHGIAPSTNPQ